MSLGALLSQDSIQLRDACQDWEEAVFYACKPLEDGGFVSSDYAKNIIKNTHELGPYFVLASDLALLHARPEQGVIETQLAITVIRQGVAFKEGDEPVRVLVALASKDPIRHIEIMRSLAGAFANASAVQALAEATSSQEIYDKFMSVSS